jgi:hypothetical protein
MSQEQIKLTRQQQNVVDKVPKRVTEERFEGSLENIFGLKLPTKPQAEPDEEQNFAAVLENVYGVKLPSEMVGRAYSIFIKEYKT